MNNATKVYSNDTRFVLLYENATEFTGSVEELCNGTGYFDYADDIASKECGKTLKRFKTPGGRKGIMLGGMLVAERYIVENAPVPLLGHDFRAGRTAGDVYLAESVLNTMIETIG